MKGAPKKKKSKNQLNKLIEAFKTNHKPNRADIINLSEQTQLPIQEVRQWFNNQRRKIKKDESNEYNTNTSGNTTTNNNNNNNNSGSLNKSNTVINQYVQYQYTFEHPDSLLSTNSNSSLLNAYLPPSQQQQQQQSLLPPPSQSPLPPLPPSSQQQQQQISQSSSSISNQSQQLQIQHSAVDISSNLSSSNTQSQMKNTINNNKMKKLKNVLPSNQQQEQQTQQQLINEKYIKTECNSFLKELKASSKLEKTCYLRYLIEGINKTDRKQMNKLLKENFENENINYGNCNYNNDSNTYGSMRPYKPSSDITLSTETHRKRSIQAWNQLAKVFGAEEEKKGGNNYDLAMFNGLKYMFSNHRDYLTELCKVYGISTFKEEYQKQMSDQEMSDEPNDKL